MAEQALYLYRTFLMERIARTLAEGSSSGLSSSITPRSALECALTRMITDVQLAVFANVLGVSLFLLVVLYHYISANHTKSS
ncbi:uncharacterized protein [Bemisia tabaci]|uniref:uncharacterized protein n=1 Tax=Bemisia tabaci TaxID=7038 RepID=UPI003B27B452